MMAVLLSSLTWRRRRLLKLCREATIFRVVVSDKQLLGQVEVDDDVLAFLVICGGALRATEHGLCVIVIDFREFQTQQIEPVFSIIFCSTTCCCLFVGVLWLDLGHVDQGLLVKSK